MNWEVWWLSFKIYQVWGLVERDGSWSVVLVANSRRFQKLPIEVMLQMQVVWTHPPIAIAMQDPSLQGACDLEESNSSVLRSRSTEVILPQVSLSTPPPAMQDHELTWYVSHG